MVSSNEVWGTQQDCKYQNVIFTHLVFPNVWQLTFVHIGMYSPFNDSWSYLRLILNELLSLSYAKLDMLHYIWCRLGTGFLPTSCLFVLGDYIVSFVLIYKICQQYQQHVANIVATETEMVGCISKFKIFWWNITDLLMLYCVPDVLILWLILDLSWVPQYSETIKT